MVLYTDRLRMRADECRCVQATSKWHRLFKMILLAVKALRNDRQHWRFVENGWAGHSRTSCQEQACASKQVSPRDVRSTRWLQVAFRDGFKTQGVPLNTIGSSKQSASETRL